MRYKPRIVTIEETARACKNNGKSLARLTEEGWICKIRGKCCPNQGDRSSNYTNFYFCTPKQKETQSLINYNQTQTKGMNYGRN